MGILYSLDVRNTIFTTNKRSVCTMEDPMVCQYSRNRIDKTMENIRKRNLKMYPISPCKHCSWGHNEPTVPLTSLEEHVVPLTKNLRFL